MESDCSNGVVKWSRAMFTAHYLVFQDSHYRFIFFVSDIAFILIEVLVVTLIIDAGIPGKTAEDGEVEDDRRNLLFHNRSPSSHG